MDVDVTVRCLYPYRVDAEITTNAESTVDTLKSKIYERYREIVASPHSFRLTFDGRVLGYEETIGSLLPSKFPHSNFHRPKLTLYMSVDFRSPASLQKVHSQLSAAADLALGPNPNVLSTYVSSLRASVHNATHPTGALSDLQKSRDDISALSQSRPSSSPPRNGPISLTPSRTIDPSTLPPSIAARLAHMNEERARGVSPTPFPLPHDETPLYAHKDTYMGFDLSPRPNMDMWSRTDTETLEARARDRLSALLNGKPAVFPPSQRLLDSLAATRAQLTRRARRRSKTKPAVRAPPLLAGERNRIFHRRRPGNTTDPENSSSPGSPDSDVHTGVVLIETDHSNLALQLPPGMRLPVKIPPHCILIDGQGDIPEPDSQNAENLEHVGDSVPAVPVTRGPTEVDGVRGSVVGTVVVGEAALLVSAALGVTSAALPVSAAQIEEFLEDGVLDHPDADALAAQPTAAAAAAAEGEGVGTGTPLSVELTEFRDGQLLFATMTEGEITFAPLPAPVIPVPQRDRWLVSKRLGMLLALVVLHHAEWVWGHKGMVAAAVAAVLVTEWFANVAFDWVYRRVKRIQMARAQVTHEPPTAGVGGAGAAAAEAGGPPNANANAPAPAAVAAGAAAGAGARAAAIGPAPQPTPEPPAGVLGALWWFFMGLFCSVVPAWRHPVVPFVTAEERATGGAASEDNAEGGAAVGDAAAEAGAAPPTGESPAVQGAEDGASVSTTASSSIGGSSESGARDDETASVSARAQLPHTSPLFRSPSSPSSSSALPSSASGTDQGNVVPSTTPATVAAAGDIGLSLRAPGEELPRAEDKRERSAGSLGNTPVDAHTFALGGTTPMSAPAAADAGGAGAGVGADEYDEHGFEYELCDGYWRAASALDGAEDGQEMRQRRPTA